MRSIQFVFNGEVGWEAIHWQAYCRKRAKDFDVALVHSVNPSMAPLYADFAEYDFRRTNATECWVKDRLIPFDHQEFIKYGSKESKLLLPKTQKQRKSSKYLLYQENEIITPYSPQKLNYVLIHARQSKNVSKNYPIDQWNKTINLLKKKYGNKLLIYCIGSYKESVHIQDTIDLRNIPLRLLFDVMANAKVIIGPSSGPMHLASLCDCPAVVWADGRTYRGQFLKDRYETSWNPFKTPVEFIQTELDWLARPEEIVKRAGKFL